MRIFARQLRHSPQTSLVIVLTLTAAIGFNVLSFSFVDAVLLERLPYPQADRLYLLWNSPPKIPIPFLPLSDYNVINYAQASESFESLTAFRIRFRENNRAMILAGETPEWVDVVMTGASLSRTLQVEPILGRAFREGEDRAGAPRVALLSHAFWRLRFEGDRDILGQKIVLNKEPHEIVGVLPPGVYFPVPFQDLGGNFIGTQAQIIVPLQLEAERPAPFSNRSIVRLKAGVSPDQARSELEPLARHFAQEIFPDPDLDGLTVLLSSLAEGAVGHLRRPLLGLQAAAFLILFIACVNVANLMLSRTVERERDWAVRTALGASRKRMLLFVVAEGVVLSLLAAAVGLTAAIILRNPVLELTSPYIPHVEGVVVGGKEIAFALLLGLAAGLLSSLIPA
ncbi:MAG TPA: ABC transporter permease, partial [Acidobacteriota bacterium]|nr:ABC transporter permease [Acidobacteriota bacterium]